MSIAERNLTLSQLVTQIRDRQGHKPSLSTVFRWATRGIRGHRLPTTLTSLSHFWEGGLE